MTLKDKKDKVWERWAGDKKQAKDAYGVWMKKPLYGKEGQGAWEIDHIKPKSRGGTDALYNLRPLSPDENREKADKIPRSRADKKGLGKPAPAKKAR